MRGYIYLLDKSGETVLQNMVPQDSQFQREVGLNHHLLRDLHNRLRPFSEHPRRSHPQNHEHHQDQHQNLEPDEVRKYFILSQKIGTVHLRERALAARVAVELDHTSKLRAYVREQR